MKKIAMLAPLVWLGWLVLIDWVPMFPLNDLAAISAEDRALAALANYPIPLLIAGAVALDRTWTRITAIVLSTLCLAGHLMSWWIPYFGPATAAQRADYQKYYTETLRFLPTAGHDVVIDVQHTVVALLTLAMLAATIVFAIRSTGRLPKTNPVTPAP
ncbi:hypothetical protein [Nonomuraea jiangxiensis]|uniref:Uncharacterized protein n=1 Tax=Nonomuraea jiangxiensis TaxID=633440 RepID=A0A1G8PXL4_9ACTN|nr:hypothetical protein [Nonomuraea jiangxiensis]SDI97232.1 hypothetical protein SAMN05421869_10865 [Nonomuraea jiangxiensis]